MSLKLLPFTNEYAAAAEAMEPTVYREMTLHGDVLDGSEVMVLSDEGSTDEETKIDGLGRRLLGFGYLLAGQSYLARESVENRGPYHVSLVFKADLRSEAGLDAAEMLISGLLSDCKKRSEADFAHPITPRVWANESDEAYGEFMESFGFRETDRMWVMVKKLRKKGGSFLSAIFRKSMAESDSEVREMTAELSEEEPVMKDYIAGTEEAFGLPDSVEEMKYRLHYGGGRVFTKAGKSFVTTWPMDGETAATENIFTRKEERRKGHCRALIGGVCEILAGEGVRKARLNVYEWNRGAIALYEKCGYKHVRTLRELTIL